MAEPVARKQLELSMKVTADTKAASATMQALTRDAEKAGAAVKSLSAGGGAAGVSPAGNSGGLAGAIGSAANLLAVPAMLTGIAATAANMTRAFQALGNEFLTTEEKVLGFAKSLPVVGNSLASLIANVSEAFDRIADPETARRVDRMRYTNSIEMGRAGARTGHDMGEASLKREAATAQYRLQAIRENPMLASQMALLTGGVGGVSGAFLGAGVDAIDPRITQSLEAVQAAKRDVRAASLAASASDKDVEDFRGGARAANRALALARQEGDRQLDAARGLGDPRTSAYDKVRHGGGNKFHAAAAFVMPSLTGTGEEGTTLKLAEASMNVERAKNAALLANQEFEAKITANKQNQLALAQKQYELAKAETGVLRTKYQIIKEQEQQVRGGTQQLGLMSASDRQGVLASLKRFQELGREGITQDELGILTSSDLTREFVGKRAGNDLKDDPTLKQILDIVGKKNADQLAEEAKKIKSELDLKVQLDEEQFAKVTAEAMKKLNLKDLLGEIVKAQFDIKFREANDSILRGKAERAGG